MVPPDALGLFAGAVALGAIHGMEPGHGWPVAATYALDRTNHVLYGLLASLVIGVGHLVSSLVMVAVFFYLKAYFDLEQVNDPITVLGDVQIGGPVSVVAGVLLIGLGIREALYGHSHGHGGAGEHDHGGADDDGQGHSHGQGQGHDHDHDHDGNGGHGYAPGDHDHDHGPGGHSHDHGPGGNDHGGHTHDHDYTGHTHDHDDHGDSGSGGGIRARLRGLLPGSGGHSHDHEALEGGADRGLYGIAWFAFVLGFAHEEEFEIIALCAGSVYCLELMVAYALTVILAIVGLTMLLIAGYRRAEERVERYTPYLPLFSAVVLVGMGLGFVAGVF